MGRDQRIMEASRSLANSTIITMVNEQLGDALPFGSRTSCTKCGGLDHHIERAFCPGYSPIHPNADKMLCRIEEQHLHVRCGQCGYEWREWCKDREPVSLVEDTTPSR